MLPVPNPHVIYRSLSEGAVLFSSTDEVYFGLNSVAARVWELLPPATETLDELCATIEREYSDVAPATIRADVAELLESLAAQRLVLPREVSPIDGESVARAAAEAGEAPTGRVG